MNSLNKKALVYLFRRGNRKRAVVLPLLIFLVGSTQAASASVADSQGNNSSDQIDAISDAEGVIDPAGATSDENESQGSADSDMDLDSSDEFADIEEDEPFFDSVESQGFVGMEARAFTVKGLGKESSKGKSANVSAVARLIIEASKKPFKFYARGFLRYDVIDGQRSALFPEDVFVEFKKNPFRIRLGYQLQNWTATEAFHPGDVINSRYLDGNVQNQEKLGELMASARLKFLEGNIEAYFMPFFVDPILPSSESRFRFFPKGAEIGETLILDRSGDLAGKKDFYPQFGARLQQSFWGADIGLHFVQHIDRTLPLVIFDPRTPEAAPTIAYQDVSDIGGTVQKVIGSFIVKAEVGYRKFAKAEIPGLGAVPNRDHTLAALGVEWGLQVGGGETVFLLEGQNAFGLSDDLAGLLIFQRDVLFGFRHDFADAASQTLTGSVIMDVENPDQIFANAEYGRRLGENWKTQLGFRLIHYPPEDEAVPVGPEFLHNANYAYWNLSRYF